jgi:hypothetical protein
MSHQGPGHKSVTYFFNGPIMRPNSDSQTSCHDQLLYVRQTLPILYFVIKNANKDIAKTLKSNSSFFSGCYQENCPKWTRFLQSTEWGSPKPSSIVIRKGNAQYSPGCLQSWDIPRPLSSAHRDNLWQQTEGEGSWMWCRKRFTLYFEIVQVLLDMLITGMMFNVLKKSQNNYEFTG